MFLMSCWANVQEFDNVYHQDQQLYHEIYEEHLIILKK